MMHAFLLPGEKIVPLRRGTLSVQLHLITLEDRKWGVAVSRFILLSSFLVLPCLHTSVPAG